MDVNIAVASAMPAADGILAAENLHVQRGGKSVLSEITLHARAGRLLALVGPNGAGKSTLLAALAGLLTPTQGSVTLDGVPLARWSARALARRRAMLSQSVHTAFGFSALEVALLGRSPHAGTRGRADAATIAACALRAARVWHLRDRNYLELSGGEQRRVQLARVLAQVWDSTESAWLLLDEPEAGLDIAHQHFMLRTAQQMAARGCGVIAVLHDLNLAARYADDVALLAGGRLVRHGPPGQVLEPKTLSPVYGIAMRRTRASGCNACWLVTPC